MSLITTTRSGNVARKGAIVLFQHGIFGNQDSMTATIKKIEEVKGAKNSAYPDGFINMTGFVQKGYKKGLFFDTLEQQNVFLNTMKGIKEYADTNPYINVLVRTNLSGKDTYDSIYLQSEKLEFIIKYINENFEGRKIILVGHSQGGLVNMEASLRCPNMVSKMISFNTPYAVNSIGDDLYPLARLIMSFAGGFKYELNDTEMDLSDERVDAALRNLKSFDYFDDLKKRWDEFQNKPPLYKIVGLSGILKGQTFRCNRTFDGLVTVDEMLNISATDTKFIKEYKTDCPDPWYEFLFEVDYTNVCTSCSKGCDFPKLNFLDELVEIFKKWINHNFNLNTDELEIMKAIQAGLKHEDYTGSKTDIYKVYKNECNHLNILTNYRAIYYLSGILG